MRDIEEAIFCIRLTFSLVPVVRQAKSHETDINVVSYSLWSLVENSVWTIPATATMRRDWWI